MGSQRSGFPTPSSKGKGCPGFCPVPMHTRLSMMAETSSQDLTSLCLRPAQQCSLVPGGWTQAPK
uniref:Uncharacterized protein n=1 Tax=Nomascus leucogenys TaxID=61853 RepID=A0A2I3FWF9_NOMLE